MNWNEVTIYTEKEAIEPLCAVIMDLGISSFVVEDPDEIRAFLEETSETWDMVDEELENEIGSVRPNIKIYVSEDEEGTALMQGLYDRIDGLKADEPELYSGIEVDTVNVKDEDWQYNWREFFKPFTLGEKLYIRPVWDDSSVDGRITVLIDPGSSFGSGQHETTRMALESLEKYVTEGARVADIGSGSGILSAAAALLGASKVIGIDIDPNAVTATRECAELNGVSGRVEAVCSNLADALTVPPEIVVANIFAGPICELSGQLKELLPAGSVFISTGIIESRADEVIEAFGANGFEVIEKRNIGQWYLIVGKRI